MSDTNLAGNVASAGEVGSAGIGGTRHEARHRRQTGGSVHALDLMVDVTDAAGLGEPATIAVTAQVRLRHHVELGAARGGVATT